MIYREATGSESWGDGFALAADMAEGHQFPLSVVKVDPAIIDTIAEALGSSFSRIGMGSGGPAQAINRDRYVAAFAAIGRDLPDWMRERTDAV
jgi:hypothetical protein